MKKPSQKARAQKRQQQRLRRELIRIGEYLISGGLYFWTGYAVFFVTDTFLGFNLFWAKLVANIVGWTVNFLVLRFWVFANPNLSKHQVDVTGRYIFITLVNFLLDYVIVYLLTLVGVTPYIGQFVSAGFFTVWNYIWYKTFVFTTHLHRRPRAKNKRR
jgi:putative flippase GtrA